MSAVTTDATPELRRTGSKGSSLEKKAVTDVYVDVETTSATEKDADAVSEKVIDKAEDVAVEVSFGHVAQRLLDPLTGVSPDHLDRRRPESSRPYISECISRYRSQRFQRGTHLAFFAHVSLFIRCILGPGHNLHVQAAECYRVPALQFDHRVCAWNRDAW